MIEVKNLTKIIVFIVVSFFLSSLTTGLVTYISVVERTEEVGILRSIGASKRDVARVFHAEILMLGIFSGSSGMLAAMITARKDPVRALRNER